MLSTMPAREYAHHLAMFALDPWDERRADLRAAYQTGMTAWVNGNKKWELKHAMPYAEMEKKLIVPRESNKRPKQKLKTEDVMNVVEQFNIGMKNG